MDADKLKEILDLHGKWLRNESGGVRAYLRSADLRYAYLRSAYLRSADLRYADLRYADLRCADLRCADLRYADLRYAYLRSADLREAKGIEPFRWLIAPQSGPFWAYKKVAGDAVLLLQVPEDAKRVNAPGSRKIRVSKALVAKVVEGEGESWTSRHDRNFSYTLGQEVSADMDESPYVECSAGIHVFLTLEEAKEFGL